MRHPAAADGVVRATQIVAFLRVYHEGERLRVSGVQRRSEEGLVTLNRLALVKLYGDGDDHHTLKPLREAAERIVAVRRQPIEVVRFTLREHCEWIEPPLVGDRRAAEPAASEAELRLEHTSFALQLASLANRLRTEPAATFSHGAVRAAAHVLRNELESRLEAPIDEGE